jgi:hypothetical protein
MAANTLIHHPDGNIIFKEADGTESLILTLPQFLQMESAYTIKDGSEDDRTPISRIYRQEDYHILSNGSDQWSGFMPWNEGDIYLSRVEAYRAELASMQPQPTLEDIKAGKLAALSYACQEEVFSGFSSDALGSPHTYSSQIEDQMNLIGVQIQAIAGQSVNYVCVDSAGVKEGRLHTPAQIQQVFAAGAGIKQNLISKFHQLREQVEAATIADVVHQISW